MTLADVHAAAGRLEGVAQHTPLTHSSTFSALAGAEVYLKCENLQRTGSFKIRGAYNRLSLLPRAAAKRGVVAASAGNHAQGVALAARLLGLQATVFMPESTPLAKVAATQGYGATIRIEGRTLEETLAAALREKASSGATFVHPFDDEAVIAGQGTIAREIVDDLPEVDAIVVPVGGGGLIAGIAVAAKALRPEVRVFGVEASLADAVHAALRSDADGSYADGSYADGELDGAVRRGRGASEGRAPSDATIADGINVRQPGSLTLPIIERLVEDVVTVEEDDISRAVVMLLERSKLVVEGAGAVGLAALLSGRLQRAGQRVAVVLSGGNIDVNLMARIIEHGLATSGRYLAFETWLQDRPGELLKVLQTLMDERVNILSVEHRRPASFPEVEVMLTVETRDAAHGERLLDRLRKQGYRVSRLELGAR